MSDQTFTAFPIRPGFPYRFVFGPQKIDADNPAFPAGAEYRSRITSDPDNPANGAEISTLVGGGIVRLDDNNLALTWDGAQTSTLATPGASSIACFDVVRSDAGNEEHLNIEVDLPIKRSITPPA